MLICSHQTLGRNKRPVLRAKGIPLGKIVKLKLQFFPVEVSEKVRVQDAISVKPCWDYRQGESSTTMTGLSSAEPLIISWEIQSPLWI